MFLRATARKKDGKEHTYYSVVENRRLADGRVVQRHMLYLGEPTAAVLEQMRSSQPPVQYLVGTPKLPKMIKERSSLPRKYLPTSSFPRRRDCEGMDAQANGAAGPKGKRRDRRASSMDIALAYRYGAA
ncbi:MAG: hypothetical protein LBQ20_08855 [Rhodanobacter sp.]|jgi:hypothetical protein|nr:hypothetical protein [Rhodanobacter sp.]